MDEAGRGDGAHLDEGTIHAWLDDALDATESARAASHVASCAQCAAAVAEARGLIAGASRVVRALDDDVTVASSPAPAWGSPAAAAAPKGRWSALRVTRSRAAIAASLIVALGVTLTYSRSGVQESALLQTHASAVVVSSAPGASRDPLLDSAIKRNVAAAQPQRAVEPAASPAVPQAPAPSVAGNTTAYAEGASEKVAGARAAAQALRDSSPPAADQLRASSSVAVSKDLAASDAFAPEPGAMAKRVVARRARPAQQVPALDRDEAHERFAATECYRLESSVADAAWGPERLPFTVTLRPGGGTTTGPGVIAGAQSGSLVWSRGAGDTLQLRLRRIGYSGEVVLAAGDDERSGTMRSAPMSVSLNEVVVTGAASGRADSAAGGDRGAAKARTADAAAPRRQPSSASSAVVGSAVTQRLSENDALRSVPVVARKVSCPAP